MQSVNNVLMESRNGNMCEIIRQTACRVQGADEWVIDDRWDSMDIWDDDMLLISDASI